MATIYTEENPYRISPTDALNPSIYVHQIRVMKANMAAGPMWIIVLGSTTKQYASLAEVKQEMSRILCVNVEAEGDEKAYKRLMSK